MPHVRCETCGNEYDHPFQIVKGDKSYVFDSFECAIQALAPACGNCGVRVLGHGVQEADQIYCCAHCAAAQGADQVRDRA